MINYKAIGQRIKAMRKALGLTQEKLAETLSISTEHLSRIETGTYHPSLTLISKLSDTLQTDEKMLMFGDINKTEKYRSLINKFDELTPEKQAAVISLIDIISDL